MICGLLDQLHPRSDGLKYASQIIFVDDRPGHDRRYAIDAAKISHELGWTPKNNFESGIRQTIRWYLDHPEWVAHIQSGNYRDWLRAHYQENR